MRKYITEHTVYNFNELSQEAKEKAIEQFRDNENFYFLSDDMQYHLEGLLKDNKITYGELPKVFYSLSWSQGDGAMFEGRIYWKSYTADIKQSGHYYHYNSKNIELYSTKTDKEASDKVYDQFNDLYVDICKKLERYGYDCIDYALSEEAIIETIEANEYEFTKEGALA